MKEKFKRAYMQTAQTFAKLSSARRLHVGAIVVKNDRIISIGYNGMPAGWDNNCEDIEWMDPDAGGWLDPIEIQDQWPYQEQLSEDSVTQRRYRLTTKPEVLHAETNAIAKLAKSNDSGEGSTLFVTHAPCLDCAKLIYQSGIKHVVYAQNYRSDSGLKFLRYSGVKIEQLLDQD
jgi:dCMP deaminase